MASWIPQGHHVLLAHVLAAETMNTSELRINTTHLFLLQHLILHEGFHGIYSACVRLLDEPHLIKETIRCGSFSSHNGGVTSPKAPFPMTLTVLKSSSPSFVRRSRKNVDSFFPRDSSWRCFRSSLVKASAANFRSSSTRLSE